MTTWPSAAAAKHDNDWKQRHVYSVHAYTQRDRERPIERTIDRETYTQTDTETK